MAADPTSPTTPSTAQPTAPTARWVKLALVASLGLNLLILGIVAGAWLSPEGPRSDRIDAAARDIGATPFIRALEPADRRALFQAFRREDEPLRQNREELRLRFEALLGALRADPFDPFAVQSLLQLQRGAATERQMIGERLLVEQLAQMSPEARDAFADRLEASLRRGPRGDGRDGRDGD
jgi:uncharacterized membrane protein